MLIETMKPVVLTEPWAITSLFDDDCSTIIFDPTAFIFPSSDGLFEQLDLAIHEGKKIVVPEKTLLATKQTLNLFSESDSDGFRSRGERARRLLSSFEAYLETLDDSTFVTFGQPETVLNHMARHHDCGDVLVTGNQMLAFLWQYYKESAGAIVFTEDTAFLVKEKTDALMVKPDSQVTTLKWKLNVGSANLYYNEPLRVEYTVPGSNTVTYDFSKRTQSVKLDEESVIGEGFEAIVVSGGRDDGALIKLYKRLLTAQDEKRMEDVYLWATDDYAYPTRKYYLDSGFKKLCGYRMPKQGGDSAMDMDDFISSYVINVPGEDHTVTLEDALDILIEFIVKVKYVHLNGAIISDYNHGNFRIDLTCPCFRKVKFIDVLGYMVDNNKIDTRAAFEMPKGVIFGRGRMSSCIREDLFVFKIAVFGILNALLGGPKEAYSDGGIFFYLEDGKIKPEYKESWDFLPPVLKDHFEHAFVFDGAPHMFDDGDTLLNLLYDWRESLDE